MSNKVQINDLVALQEQAALAEYYRNRSLIQAQAIFDVHAELATLQEELQALKSSAANGAMQEVV